jgi:alkanesulfonate monooxygenase SsuD/methylene tetrahydromethanopterin reductase-like flavin-dependent oxidoreductase (luciferase family)
VGIGWLREEFEAMGTPFERRGARFDEYVAAMRKVWSGEVVEHESEHVHWTGFKSHPLPVQDPFPVVIGGSKGKAFERIAKYGQGWFAPTISAEQLEPLLRSLEKACAAEGRDLASVEISAMWVPAMGGLDALRRYEDLGVSRLIVPAQALGGGNPVDALDQLARDVLAQV